jgi:hypothetical protein
MFWWGRGDLNPGQVVTSPENNPATPLSFKFDHAIIFQIDLLNRVLAQTILLVCTKGVRHDVGSDKKRFVTN